MLTRLHDVDAASCGILLIPFGVLFVVGMALLFVSVRPWTLTGLRSRRPRLRPGGGADGALDYEGFQLPRLWLAVRARRPEVVGGALGVVNASACRAGEAMARFEDHRLWVSPAFRGWVLVVGQDLPDPTLDVDAAFRFLLDLSRRAQEVHFFLADVGKNQHGWAWLQSGVVRRAYVWSGTTLWNQGEITPAEATLGMRCFPYGTATGPLPVGWARAARANTNQVADLAGAWSVHPLSFFHEIDQRARGLSGSLAHSKLRD